MVKLFSTLACIFVLQFSFAQTLLKNSDFEETDSLGAKDWTISALTPDIKSNQKDKFYTEDKGCKESVKNHFLGIMSTGEVISTKLKAPLEKDALYCVKMKVQKPSNFCPKGLSKTTVAFTSSPLKPHPEGNNYFYPVKFLNLYSENLKPIKENCVWEEFSAVFMASGDEKYFHIGDFRKTKEAAPTTYTGVLSLDSLEESDCGYKHIDNIEIEKVNLSKTTPMVFDGIHFDADKSVLLPSSNKELEKLYVFVMKLNKRKIIINGHADDAKDKARNTQLSKERAEAVMNYLIKKGIPKASLKAVGYGDTKPLSANKTRSNRIELQLAE